MEIKIASEPAMWNKSLFWNDDEMTITFRQQFWMFEVNLGFIWSNEYNKKNWFKIIF